MTGIAGREWVLVLLLELLVLLLGGRGDLVLVRDREPVLGLVQDVQHHLSDAVSVGGLVLLAHDLDVPQLPEVEVALLLQTLDSQLHLHHLCVKIFNLGRCVCADPAAAVLCSHTAAHWSSSRS